MSEINIFRCLETIKENSEAMAQAKANRVYCEEYRKSLKAILMQKSQEKSQNGKESDAYASQEYLEHIDALREAVGAEEGLRWKMIACQAEIEVWRSLGANQRAEAKAI